MRMTKASTGRSWIADAANSTPHSTPSTAPIISATTNGAVFVIVYAWNEFLFAFIFTTTRAKTAPLVVAEMIGAVEGVEWGVLFAASAIQLLPVLVFVILMQKHLVAGLTAGAVKG